MKGLRICAVLIAFAFALSAGAEEDISSDVVAIDHKLKQLTLDWHNDTKRLVHWTSKTKITVLETGKSAPDTELRVGSYLRIQGTEKDGKFTAREIEIFEGASVLEE